MTINIIKDNSSSNSFIIRNFVHDKYNIHFSFNLKDYTSFLHELKNIGVNEIEHAASNIKYSSQEKRLKEVTNIIRDLGLVSVLYTGVFGVEDLKSNPSLLKYAQRSFKGDVLSFNGLRSAMMCPSSNYIDEYSIPKVSSLLSLNTFDKVFIDIPWIMKGGCFCNNCYNGEIKKSNDESARGGLEKFTNALKLVKSDVKISVNASAPTIHNNKYSGAHIDNLVGLFDEYVTEWNPYRWNQKSTILKNCISYAKSKTNKDVFHATTLTNRKGELYSKDEYVALFKDIFNSGANLRLGIGFSGETLSFIGSAITDSLKENSKNKNQTK